jgi:hypothetical protein
VPPIQCVSVKWRAARANGGLGPNDTVGRNALN